MMQQYKEREYFSFGVKLWAKFPISAGKIKNFISHKLRGLFIQRKGNFDHASEAIEKFLRLSPLECQTTPFWQVGKKSLSSLIPRQKRNQARSHGNCHPWATGCHLFAAHENFLAIFLYCFIFVAMERSPKFWLRSTLEIQSFPVYT